MTETEARNIGNSFLKRRKLDINSIAEGDQLGEIYDYNIFYAFPIVGESGELYLGGLVLLLDKRTNFCLLIASSPNFHDYHVKLFRIIILNQLYDSKIDLEEYQKKKINIDYQIHIDAIFLLLQSHPENFNAFFEFLERLILLDKSLYFDEETFEIFTNGFRFFKSNSLITSKVQELEKVLLMKNLSIEILTKKYEPIWAERQKRNG